MVEAVYVYALLFLSASDHVAMRLQWYLVTALGDEATGAARLSVSYNTYPCIYLGMHISDVNHSRIVLIRLR